MYLDFFGLKELPFQLTADPRFLYLSQAHSKAKAYMDYAIYVQDSFVVITGEIGAGKTMLVEKLVSELDANVMVARIHQTQLTEKEFLQALLLQFGQKRFEAGKVELLDALNGFLVEQFRRGQKVLLIVDEAQKLGSDVLEEIRMLSDLEVKKQKVLNVILLGQPELNQTLDAPGLEQLNQRVRLRFHLKALSEEETREYIEHRLVVAGGQNRALFPAQAASLIYRYTSGVPRLVNKLCDLVLTTAFVDEQHEITEALIEKAVDELQWKAPGEGPAASGAEAHPAPIADEVARLVLSIQGHVVGEYALARKRMTVGRYPDNDIVLTDRLVSRHHVQIITHRGESYVEDLDTVNGTYVNGKRVKTRLLRDGDVVTVGKYRLEYQRDADGDGGEDTQELRVVSDQAPSA